jgi:hypothetical protein
MGPVPPAATLVECAVWTAIKSLGHSRVQADRMMNMTLEQLERRVHDLERQVAELRGEMKSLRPMGSIKDTFGMFAADPQFNEIVRLGREYRDQVNSEDQ